MYKLTNLTFKGFKERQRFLSSSFRSLTSNLTATNCIELEKQYSTNNYSPIPVVISSALGTKVWDIEGKEYLDFLSAYSAVNQGHNHKKIVNSMIKQSQQLSLTSRAFYNDKLGEFSKYICNLFNYDKVLMMNTGVEACESSVKIARRWGYEKKGIQPNDAIMIFMNNCFWGRSIAAISASTDPDAYSNYGPYVPNFINVEYNDISELEKVVLSHSNNICGIMLESIQGEAGVIIPDKYYLKQIRQLCNKYNILMIIDEVQTGLGRCGELLCSEGVFDVVGDIITLGKALSGGIYPISCVLGKDDIMSVLTPNTHGSTYGGNPLACEICMTALNVLLEEDMILNSRNMGKILLNGLKEINNSFDIIDNVRGCGLFCAMEIKTDSIDRNAWKLCLEMKNRGLLAKPTHKNIIRLSPPLIINKQEIEQSLNIIYNSIKSF